MAKNKEAKCKICRREGVKLFLKGERCNSDKCSFDRKPYSPGLHGREKKRVTEYKIQLREKQKTKAMYGMLERQFSIFYKRADLKKGATGENLLRMLECRLDNVVYRLGFANSRAQARQLINHRHFSVNGKGTDIPSFIVKEGDIIAVKEGSRDAKIFKEIMADENIAARIATPAWLELNKDEMKGKVIRLPEREDLPQDVKENLIVELYSK
ncbi:30S ribosomal protein S4 [bacterium]|nr:30S ribosomal protein S4 [bacterium]MBQ3368500.1 30S ribosomal protein S4 [bacterium]MBQ4439105.1 30S ribosomal protein S4 [bacterium]MBR4530944.1 30S ribosomal protein S4 [bacterium]MBR6421800.1 30S ribosomal protein S4 [bacterium]